jgi:cytochrome P450
MTTGWDVRQETKLLRDNPAAEAADVYAELLARCPVSHVHVEDAKVHWWGAFGFDELKAVLKDYRAFSSNVAADENGYPNVIPLFADPPLHTGFRKLLNPNFPQNVVARIEKDITIFAEEMIDELVAQGDVEFYTAFAVKFPTRVLCRFLGVPDEDWPIHFDFVHGDDRADFLSAPDEIAAMDPFTAFLPYIQSVIDKRRAHPQDDIINSFVTGEVEGRKLRDPEIVQLIIAMMLAGHATTTAAISNFVHRIAADQELQRKLRANLHRIPDALEESLRMDAPQQALLRKCVADVKLGGQSIKAGEFLLTNYGSANNDPRRFPDPAKFDLDRAGKGHLSFGFGMHSCLGQHLARLDMKIAMETLLRRTSSITLSGPVKRTSYPVLAAVELPLKLRKSGA